MHRVFFALLGCLLAFSAKAEIEVSRVDLGVRSPGERVNFELSVSNKGADSISFITQLPLAWHGLRIEGLPASISAGETKKFKVQGTVGRFLGLRNHRIDLMRSDGVLSKLSIPIFTYSGFFVAPEISDFGVVRSGESGQRRLQYRTEDYDNFSILSGVDPDSVLDVSVVGRDSLGLSVPEGAPWGLYKGWIRASTDLEEQPEVWSEYTVEVRGAVRPSTYDLHAGLLRRGEENSHFIFFDDESGKRLRLGDITVKGSSLGINKAACPNRRRDCRALRVVVPNEIPSGQFESFIVVAIPDYKQSLTIRVSGILIDSGREITSLNPPINDDAENTEVSDAVLDVLSHITTSTQGPLIMPDPPGVGPLLSWTVRNDGGIYGYLVYRADEKSEMFFRVSDEFIRASPTYDGRSVTYKWRDVMAGVSCNCKYKVVAVNSRGERVELTGPASFGQDSGKK